MYCSTRSYKPILLQSLKNLKFLKIIRSLLPNIRSSIPRSDLNMFKNLVEEFKDLSFKDLEKKFKKLISNYLVDNKSNLHQES